MSHNYLVSFRNGVNYGHKHINMTSKWEPQDTTLVMDALAKDCTESPAITSIFYFGEQKEENETPQSEFLNDDELHLITLWFSWMIDKTDANLDFLQKEDFELVKKLYNKLGLTVPNLIKDNCGDNQ